MAEDGGWITRKRMRKVEGISSVGNGSSRAASASLLSTTNANDASSSLSSSAIPASLMPHLGWTKLSACHRPRSKKKRRNNDWDSDEEVQKVMGRAVFFIHDPQPNDGESDDKDESKIWFQGRFFPSVGHSAKPRNSPTSVSSDRVAPIMPSSRTNNNSWGLLAVQNTIIDECMTCSEGGYRELDLTFIRQKQSSRMSNNRKKEKKVRWVAQDVIWTGGNMMMLSSDPYSSSSLPSNEPGVKFEPQTLMEGDKALEVASKYFPSMVKRLHIHNVTNNETGDENKRSDAMVIIGDMEVVAPVSFVKIRNAAAFRRGDDSSDDGLWND